MDADARAASATSTPLGIYRGYAVAGCEPGEMGIAPGLCRAEAARRSTA